MDWEGAEHVDAEPSNGTQGSTGEVRRVSMDGTDVLDQVAGLDNAHHDLTVLPGGVVATLLWSGETSEASDPRRAFARRHDQDRRPDRRQRLPATNGTYHANSVAYHAADDTYTVGDLNAGGFVEADPWRGRRLWLVVRSARVCSATTAITCSTTASSSSRPA